MARFARLARQFVAVGPHRVAFAVAGAGPPVLLLHGLGGTADFWQPLLGRLGRHFRLICPDLLGFGLSSALRARYSPSLHLAGLLAALRAAGHTQFHAVVGHSAGGTLAALLLASGLATADRLALVAAAYPAPHFDLRAEMVRTGYARALTGNPLLGAIDHAIWRALWPLLSGIPGPLYLEGARAGLMENSPSSYYGTIEELLFRGNLDPFVPRLAGTPTLLLYGEADTTVPPVHAERFRAALPAAALVRHSGGHYGVLGEGAAPLLRWLKEGL